MKFLVVVAAFLAVATAEVREKRGIIGSTVVAGPSGSIVSTPGLVAGSLASPLLARSIVAPGLVAPGLVAPGLVAPGLVAPGVLARSVIAPGLVAPSWAAPAATVLAAPGVTAGTVVAPGTTLIGPSTNGAPGAVITNGILGSQILL